MERNAKDVEHVGPRMMLATALERLASKSHSIYLLLELDLDIAPPMRGQAQNPETVGLQEGLLIIIIIILFFIFFTSVVRIPRV